MNDCPFCTIWREQADRILKSGEKAFVLFSDPRLMPGHLLVIPVRHVEKLIDLSWDEKKELFQLVEEYEEKILKNIAKGCDIRQNYRPFIPQSRTKVNHLHIHLLPREFQDSFYHDVSQFEHAVFRSLEEKEVEEYRNLLK